MNGVSELLLYNYDYPNWLNAREIYRLADDLKPDYLFNQEVEILETPRGNTFPKEGSQLSSMYV